MICEYCATELNAVRDEESACSPRGPYMRPEEHTPERCRDALKKLLDEARARGLAPAKTYRERAEAAEKMLAFQEKLAEDFHTAALGAEARAERFRAALVETQGRLIDLDDRDFRTSTSVQVAAILAGITASLADSAPDDLREPAKRAHESLDEVHADYNRARLALYRQAVAADARAAHFQKALEHIRDQSYAGLTADFADRALKTFDAASWAEQQLRDPKVADAVLGEGAAWRARAERFRKIVEIVTMWRGNDYRDDIRHLLDAALAADSAPGAAWRGADSCILDPGERSDDGPQPWSVPPVAGPTGKELSLKTTSDSRRELRARTDDMDDRFYGTEVEDLLDDLDAALSALTSARVVAAIDWDDADDGWSKEIEAAHPLRTGAHNRYAVAMMMVGHRHSKGQLVALVCWLLGRAEEAERWRDRLWELVEESVRVVDTFNANIQGQTSSEVVDPISYGIATQYISKARAALGRAPAAPTSHASVAKALSDLLDFIFDGASYPLAYGGRFRLLACDARHALRAARGEAADDDDDRGSP